MVVGSGSSALLTVQVLELFEATLEQAVVLAGFIPLLTGMGGNTGTQAASTLTRALAVGDVRTRDILPVMFRELRVGFSLGLLMGSLGLGVASARIERGPTGIVIGYDDRRGMFDVSHRRRSDATDCKSTESGPRGFLNTVH